MQGIIASAVTRFANSMSYIDPQVVRRAVEEEGAEAFFSHQLLEKLCVLVEMETRHILESSWKFMLKDRRDVIEQEDVVEAVRDHGHVELIVDELCTRGRDDYFSAEGESMQEEIAMLQKLSIKQAHLQGRWIFINGKIPVTGDNKELRCLSQVQEDKEKKKTFVSIIKDDPMALLTSEQAEYFQKMGDAIRRNVNPRGKFTLTGDLNSLLPFFLKFLGEEKLNETGVWFLLKLIENSYIWPAIEYSLKKVLILLLAYRGQYSFEVGLRLADLIQRFEVKYPMLRDIFVDYEDNSYSTMLKKIALEVKLGITVGIEEGLVEQCREDCKKGDLVAMKLMEALLCYSSQLKSFKELLVNTKSTYIYWHPCRELKTDPYLAMF